ncbi:peptidoglycan-binding protein [Candidatus Parcubacteria bacterium]|nr:peptidoglycan-binding protein [Candidatus Parcubacteria bacterium]
MGPKKIFLTLLLGIEILMISGVAYAVDVASSKQNDIKGLQVFLNSHGFVVAKSGPGSPGKETDLLGPATKKALANFQAANGLPRMSPSSGRYGPWTKGIIAGILEKEKNNAMAQEFPGNKILENTAVSNNNPAVGGASGSENIPPIAHEHRLINSFALAWSNGLIEGIISPNGYVIIVDLPPGADITKLTSVIQTATGVAVSPKPGIVQDFSNSIIYTATDAQGTVQEYIVIVVEENSG